MSNNTPVFREQGVGALLETVYTASTGTEIVSYGIHTVGSTAAKSYNLGNPVVGREVTVYCNEASTAAKQSITPTSTSVTVSSSGARTLTFDAANECVILKAISTSQYAIVSNVGSVASS